MNEPETDTTDLTTQYPISASDELWEDWRRTVPRSYSNLNERLLELLATEVACQERHGKGVDELLIEEGIISEDDIPSISDAAEGSD